MVAGGTGIAPVSFAGQLMQRDNIDHEILYGGRDKAAVHLDELKRFGLAADPATEDGSLGFHGLVTDQMIEKLRNDKDDTLVFACGPWNMMRAATAACEQLGVECFCSLERYMACGFGVCLACIYRKVDDPEYHTCCKEGPVVVGREVDWDA
jgi:dihydroorotate dehydrogenase electron transfer subunit